MTGYKRGVRKKLFVLLIAFYNIMDWKQISERYGYYLQVYREDPPLVSPDILEYADYPLQDCALGGKTITDVSFNQLGPEQKFLIESDGTNVTVSSLPREAKEQLPIGLTRILKVQITHDHMKFWSHTYEMIANYVENNPEFPDFLLEDFRTLIHLTIGLVDLGFHQPTEPTFSYKNNTRRVEDKNYRIASFMCYPLLEGYGKFVSSEVIKMNGEIKSGQRLRKLTSPEKYKWYTDGDECSNLGAILWNIETELANADTQVRMQKMREAVGDFYQKPSEKVYGRVINNLRNSTLHGQKEPHAEVGIALNYISLLVWNEILN